MIKVERSKTAPRVLIEGTAQSRYRHSDVVEQLAHDFHDKCYICEVAPVHDPEVEHLVPHEDGKRPERMFDWNNLFYACRHCNLVKSKPRYKAGVLDCCILDPEDYLSQDLVENSVHVEVLDQGNSEAETTAELIEEVFMSENPALRKKAAEARLQKLQLQMNILYTCLQRYGEDREDKLAERTVAAMLRREAVFAGFTRSYVRRHLGEYPDLAPLLA